jgi:hypothetical protein
MGETSEKMVTLTDNLALTYTDGKSLCSAVLLNLIEPFTIYLQYI